LVTEGEKELLKLGKRVFNILFQFYKDIVQPEEDRVLLYLL